MEYSTRFIKSLEIKYKIGMLLMIKKTFSSIHKLYLTYTTRQVSRFSCVAQTGFAAFGIEVQLISGSPYAETEQLFRLTSQSGILATS